MATPIEVLVKVHVDADLLDVGPLGYLPGLTDPAVAGEAVRAAVSAGLATISFPFSSTEAYAVGIPPEVPLAP